MKKLSTIFLLLIFFLFQYGKMIDYMECRIAAAVTNTSDCGCDTELAQSLSTDDAHSAPLHQHHLKNYTEEFFHHTHTDTDLFQIVMALQFAPEKKQFEIEMAYGLFQPPRI